MPESCPKAHDLQPYVILLTVVVLSSTLFLLPFLLHVDTLGPLLFPQTGLQAVYRYWDGPLYVVVSSTFYCPESPLYAASNLWPTYYTAHFPLYPLAIALFSPFGSFIGMLVATIFFACLSVFIFYTLAKEDQLAHYPLLLALFFAFFPLRWFLYRNVGASEPAFIFFCLSSLYFLRKDQVHFSILTAALAALTRIFGLVLFPVLLTSLALKRQLSIRNVLLTLAIPGAVLGLFTLYLFSFGDFFAYFGVNAQFIQEPFKILILLVNSHFGELYGILVIVYSLAGLLLWRRGEREMAVFILFYLPLTTLVAHGDVSRYMLPMAPLALLAFEPIFPRNRILFIFIILLAAGLSMVYAWTMIPTNLMPEATFQRIVATL